MIALDSGDKIQGDSTTASKVDYTIDGVVGTTTKTVTQQADGQLPSSIGDLYTSPSAQTVIASIRLVNTNTSAESVNLYLLPSGGTARRIIPKDMSLGVDYSLIYDGKRIEVSDDEGRVLYKLDIQSLFLTEQAAAQTDVPGQGQIWVKSDTPNSLYFTDDAGTDVVVASGGAVTVTAHKDTHDPEDGSDALDSAAASEIAGVQAAGTGSSHSLARADHAHQIQHGITDNHLVTVDGTVATDDWARFTANGLVGYTTGEMNAILETDLDHGNLQGLSDDDHPQYALDTDLTSHEGAADPHTGYVKESEFTQDSGFLVGTGAGTFAEETGDTARTSLGVGTGDSPQFTAVNIGHASDTTLAREDAGRISVEGVKVVRPAAYVIAASDSEFKTQADYVCDGTDDHVQILAAIAALPATGGQILLLDGSFTCEQSIALPSYVTLRGQGRNTILTTTTANLDIITATGSSGSELVGIVVTDLCVDGNAGSATNDIGIKFSYVDHSQITNVWTQDNGEYGIYLTNCDYSRVYNCYIASNNLSGLKVSTCTNTSIIANVLQSGSDYGIYVTAGNTNTISGNALNGNTSGIYVGDAETGTTINGNSVKGGAWTISLTDVYYCTLSGNTFEDATQVGIDLEGVYHSSIVGNIANDCIRGLYACPVEYSTIQGNTISLSDYHGMIVEDSSHSNIIGNTVHSSSQDTDDTYDDIFVDNSDYCLIADNVCRAGDETNKPRYGINISNADCDGNKVINNDLTDDGFGTGTWNDAGTGTVKVEPGIDDTPVNGETGQPISSNWAYDHAADTSTHGASDIADVSDIAVDGNLSAGAQAVVTAGACDVDANLSAAAQAAIAASHTQNTDSKIIDATDGDTLVEAEEDQVTMDIGGVGESFLLDSNGNLTLAKQSAIDVTATANQTIMNGAYNRILFDSETTDIQGEFDSTVLIGTDDRANGEGADHLIDDTNSQFTSDDVGRVVWNITDNTYAEVTDYNDAGDLTLDTAIMAVGESYKLFDSSFTATAAGTYMISASVGFAGTSVDQKFIETAIYQGASKDATTRIASFLIYSSLNNGWDTTPLTIPYTLSAGDVVQVYARQNVGAAAAINYGAQYLRIIKVA